MAIFDYKCKQCNKVFETLQLNSDDLDNPCPDCGSKDTEKQLTGSVSYSIKGAGVYSPGFNSSKANKRRTK